MPGKKHNVRFGGVDVACTDGSNRFVPWHLINLGDSVTLHEARKQWPELPRMLAFPGIGHKGTARKLKRRYFRRRLLLPNLDVCWRPPSLSFRLIHLIALALMHGTLFVQFLLGPRSIVGEKTEILQHLPLGYWLGLSILFLGTAGVAGGCLIYVLIRWIGGMTRPFPVEHRIVPGHILTSLSDGRIVDVPWSEISDTDGLDGVIGAAQKIRIAFPLHSTNEQYGLFQAIVEMNRRRQPVSKRRNEFARSVAICSLVISPILVCAGVALHSLGVSAIRLAASLGLLVVGMALNAALMWVKINGSVLARGIYKWRRTVRNARTGARKAATAGETPAAT